MKHTEPHTAVILNFPRKRGRPKSTPRGTDSGTPELAMKRLKGETVEALDLCLERGLISNEQHWCGIHLRWLYTLRHGAPGIRALDTTHTAGSDLKLDDPDWRNAREKEYQDAMKKLTATGHAKLLTNICIFNERPDFLNQRTAKNADKLTPLRDGLDILIQHWRKRR